MKKTKEKSLNIKNNKAITLIALVITIIVLLILAGVTVNTLTGDNGLLQKSANAKNRNILETAKEKIKLAVLDSYGYNGKIDIQNQLNQNLKEINGLTYNDNEIDLEDTSKRINELPAKVMLDGYYFKILENGFVETIIWMENNEGSFRNVETGDIINIGDIVKYEEKLDTSALNSDFISNLATYSGSPQNTASSIRQEDLQWKVLDIENGSIRLISAIPTSSKIRLLGYNGYNNSVYLLDEICNILYSKNGIGKAQNLKIEDVIKHLTYDYTKYKNSNVDTGEYGGTKEYTTNINYPEIYSNEIGCMAISTLDNSNKTLGVSEQISLIDGSDIAEDRLKVKQTYWNKTLDSTNFKNPKYYNLFINNGTSNYSAYYLSSRGVDCSSDKAVFHVQAIGYGSKFGNGLCDSEKINDGVKNTMALRPVVTLDQNVKLSGSSEEGWTID